MAQRNDKRNRLTKEMRGKIKFSYRLIICLFLLLAGQIIYWNIKHGKEYSTVVLGQQTNHNSQIPYERGKIYDRNGNLLAGNEKLYTLILEPKNIFSGDEKKQKDYLDTTVKKVCEYFDLDEEEVREKIEANPNSYYVPFLNGKITFPEMEAFENFCKLSSEKHQENESAERKADIDAAKLIRGVSFEASFKRIYPYGSLACHLIGFTSEGNVGNWGIEQQYNSTLNGTDGRYYSYFNEELIQEQSFKDSINGNSVVSTINLQVQQIIEKKLKEFDKKIGSKETSILVMDPNSGEVLGMANSDPYDLNTTNKTAKDIDKTLSLKFSKAEIKKIKEYTKRLENGEIDEDEVANGKKKETKEKTLTKTEALSQVWRNPIISDTYEPGSTYKPFTVCAGLESGVLKGNEKYYCTGSMPVGNRRIGCSHVHGEIKLKDAIAQSCNVAMMNIAFNEGADSFYYYQNMFGFGRKTGIDLPGEADTKNVVYTAGDFRNYQNSATLATNSFGQNFNCTMIEMATAFASLINGGYFYEPHVVKEIQNFNGDIVETKEKKVLRRTVSKETSKAIRNYMRETVLTGTGQRGHIDGYSVGGKTGTAEKIPRNKEDYYISFMGFTPVDDPQLLIYVTIDEPNVKDQANSTLAVGLEQACMKEIVDVLGIQPTESTKKKNNEEYEEGANLNYIEYYLKYQNY